MLSVLSWARKALGAHKALSWATFGLAAVGLAACEPTATGPAVSNGEAVQVALLVPSGSGQASDEYLALSLENNGNSDIFYHQNREIPRIRGLVLRL